METALQQAFPTKRKPKSNWSGYADDFVVFHATEEGVKKAKTVLETWIQDIGLELKPSKTRITHTLEAYQGSAGFNFLGWTVRQVPVGKTHSGKANGYSPQLGFKTIITPSKTAVKQHTAEVGEVNKKPPHLTGTTHQRSQRKGTRLDQLSSNGSGSGNVPLLSKNPLPAATTMGKEQASEQEWRVDIEQILACG